MKYMEKGSIDQAERILWLIQYLKDENPEYQYLKIPREKKEQQRLLRGLMNVRSPQSISEEFLKQQDIYLRMEQAAKSITDIEKLQPIKHQLYLWRGDITTLKIDAIVNAGNSGLLGCFAPCHSCIDNAIHSVAGVQLRLACKKLMDEQGHEEPTGMAKITPAFNLPSQYVLHTVGPIITRQLQKNDCDMLAECYRSCMSIAAKHGVQSIAFCCISTGEFHFPNSRAAEIAVQTVLECLPSTPQIKRVLFNVFKEQDYEIYKNLLEQKE